jgi:hypothetical protein
MILSPKAEHPEYHPMRRVLALAFVAAFAVTPLAVHAQDRQGVFKAPRNALGQPDLSGTWSNSTLTPMSRKRDLGERLVFTAEEVAKLESAVEAEIEIGNRPTDADAPVNAPNGADTRPEFVAAGGDVGGYNRGWLDPGHTVMRVGGQPRTSLLTTKDGQVPPAKVARGGNFAGMGSFDNPEQRGEGERCIIGFGRNAGPPMLPNGFYNNNYLIVQSRDSVAIVVEMVHDARVIPLNAKHRTDDVRPWFGDSIGWWEGETLVVETTHIPQAQNFMGAWKDLKVTERFTRVAADRLRYTFTVSDPQVWDAPWGGEYEFSPLSGMIYEYACHEGNYALEGILAGARAKDAAATSPASSGRAAN